MFRNNYGTMPDSSITISYMNRNSYGTYVLDSHKSVCGMAVCKVSSKGYMHYLPRMISSNCGTLILTTNGELAAGTVKGFNPQPVDDGTCNACLALGMKIVQYMNVIEQTLGGNANPQFMSYIKDRGNALENDLRNFQASVNDPKTGITSKALKQLLDDHKVYNAKTFFADVEGNNVIISWHSEITRKYTGPLRSCFSDGFLMPDVAENNRDYQVYLTGMRLSKGNGINPTAGKLGNTSYQIFDYFELSKWSTLYYRQKLQVRLSPMDSAQVQYNNLITILREFRFLEK